MIDQVSLRPECVRGWGLQLGPGSPAVLLLLNKLSILRCRAVSSIYLTSSTAQANYVFSCSSSFLFVFKLENAYSQ